MEEEREEQVVDSTDNTNDYESTGEDETSEGEQGGEQQPTSKPTETPEQRNARIKRQVEREAKKAGVSVKEYLGIKSEEGNQEDSQEKWTRIELKTEGIKSKKEQDVVLNYIKEKKLLGHEVDVETALSSMVIKEELANIRKSDATPKPSSRTGQVGGEKTIEQYAELMKKGRTREVPLDKQREIRKKRLIKW